jgi:CubicO group peptidase (beta-lactamase class C family)
MIVDNGIVIDAWGDIARNFRCHSMRKSLLSGLMGTYASDGTIDLSKSLAELNINDYPNHLSDIEKKATVGDLIRARSGIYIEALGESPDMKARRPKRHSHPPGTYWYYNNWDFNALGTIFEQETGQGLFEAFDRKLARPLQMQDFDPANCSYKTNYDYGAPGLTMHRYFDMRMSARDLARFGLLFLREGRWQDKRLVPRKWVRESTASHSPIGPNIGYGYMWWTGSAAGLCENVHLKGHSYIASGWRGHRMIVLPWRNLIVVHRVDTDQPGNAVENHQFGRLLWHILDAAGESDIGPEPTLKAAAGNTLNGRQLKQILPGSTIKGPDFEVRLSKGNRFEVWSGAKRIDTGTWGVQSGKFWLKTGMLTSGQKAKLTLVLDGDRLKWFDNQGTLQGQGYIRREVISK